MCPSEIWKSRFPNLIVINKKIRTFYFLLTCRSHNTKRMVMTHSVVKCRVLCLVQRKQKRFMSYKEIHQCHLEWRVHRNGFSLVLLPYSMGCDFYCISINLQYFFFISNVFLGKIYKLVCLIYFFSFFFFSVGLINVFCFLYIFSLFFF